jgi:class 3 adenylate cyclase
MRGADLGAKDRWGNEPIHEAICSGHEDVVDAMLKAGASLSDEYIQEMEDRLRHYAARGNLENVKRLVSGGISFSARDYLGKSAVDVAREFGHSHVVGYLRSIQSLSSLQISRECNVGCNGAGAENAGENLTHPTSPSRRDKRHIIRKWTSRWHQLAVEPVSRSMASVLFLDIVGFTSMCSRLDPARVSRLLGQLMGRLDDLARLHDVQRVDVVGDAYIAATNLLKDQHADHAARLARFAVDAVAAASSVVDDWRRGEGECGDGEAVQIQVRVGMHSGAVAGLVVRGNARKHTLVGEAARGAARLEQTGLAGRVQCSEASARLIAAQARDLELHPRRREEDGEVAHAVRCALPSTYWVSSGSMLGGGRGWLDWRSGPLFVSDRAPLSALLSALSVLTEGPDEATSSRPGCGNAHDGRCAARRGVRRLCPRKGRDGALPERTVKEDEDSSCPPPSEDWVGGGAEARTDSPRPPGAGWAADTAPPAAMPPVGSPWRCSSAGRPVDWVGKAAAAGEPGFWEASTAGLAPPVPAVRSGGRQNEFRVC